MAKFDLDQLFKAPDTQPRVKEPKVTYDVRMTLNNSGENGQVVRFGFHNQAASLFGTSKYIEFSNLECTKDRLYFRTREEKKRRNIYKLQGPNPQINCCFSFTPTKEKEKAYRMNWVGKEFPLLYDAENELYYIDRNVAMMARDDVEGEG